jgi:BTB/POZ domain-containing protein 1/2
LVIFFGQGPDSFYGTRGVRKVVKVVNPQSSAVFNFIYSPGNNNGTSVEDGQIPEIIFHTH